MMKMKDGSYPIPIQTAAPKLKLMTGDRKSSCNHHYHHNSMPGRLQIIFPVEWSRGEVQLDDAGVQSIYTSSRCTSSTLSFTVFKNKYLGLCFLFY
jgi:hypothetical protein